MLRSVADVCDGGGISAALVVNRRFTDDGADQFIEAFRATMTIAQLTKTDIISGQEKEHTTPEEEEEPEMPPPPNTSETTDRVIPLPVSPTEWVNLRGHFPITEDQWNLMIGVLNAHKPGLVIPPGHQASVPRLVQRESVLERQGEDPNSLETEVRTLLESI